MQKITEQSETKPQALSNGTHQEPVKGYDLNGIIIASSYAQSFLSSISFFSFFAGIFVWAFALASPLILFTIAICSSLLYWFIDSKLDTYESSGATLKMQIVRMSKRIRTNELAIAQHVH